MNEHERPIDAEAAVAALAAGSAGGSVPLLVAVGQYSPRPSVSERVAVFALPDSAPAVLLDAWVATPEIPRLAERLGARRGEWDAMYRTGWEFAWTVDGAPFGLWDTLGRVAWQEEDGLRFRQGPPLPRHQIREAHAFVEPDWGHRGVRLETAAGEPRHVARRFEPMAGLDPTYDTFDLVCDASWAVSIARALGAALGVPVRADEPL